MCVSRRGRRVWRTGLCTHMMHTYIHTHTLTLYPLFSFQYYLNLHKYGNAETSELWEALQHQVHELARVVSEIWPGGE